MDSHIAFDRLYSELHRKLQVIARGANASVHFESRLIQTEDLGGIRFRLPKPTLLWDVKQRGSSTSNRKVAIFVDGSFLIEGSHLAKLDSAFAIYAIEVQRSTSIIELKDAFHFDAEVEPQTCFHPIFHVQRGVQKSLNLACLRSRIEELGLAERLGRQMEFREGNSSTFSRDVRIPTPQMDYGAVLVTIAADFFCEKNARNEIKAGFQQLLSVAMKSGISVQGRSAKTLEGRWQGEGKAPFCAGHWYQESCR